MNKKITTVGVILLLAIWLGLTGYAWFGPAQAESVSERRPLKQWPGISAETVLNGEFMSKFEDYTLDQFPLRDRFRQVKSMFHYYVMRQKDNNDIYIVDNYAAKLLYPLNEPQLNNSLSLFEKIYQANLKGRTKVYAAVVPDKSYYLAEANGYLSMDYDRMFSLVKEKMPWATHIDLTDSLTIADYYATDTHWRQEKILPVAQKLCEAMGVTPPQASDFTAQALERPFYGVYYGQAALPMEPETMYLMQSQLLSQCKVFDYESQQFIDVYNMDKLNGKDLYDVYLSGARGLLRIDNPAVKGKRELIVFRDSFGSSIVPLLVKDYSSVYLVDLRYLSSNLLTQYLQFRGQDVLFLYNTQVLNNTPLK